MNEIINRKITNLKMEEDKEKIFGHEYLKDVNNDILDEVKKKGYEITDIISGYKVYIKKIGESDDTERDGFGEEVSEAIYMALPS